jgi:uncharacterized protein (UPF0332 family)
LKSRPEIDLGRYRFEKASNNLLIARDAFSLGHYDEAVGRSYYCIFTAMRSLLALKGVDSKSHKGVIILFGKHFIKEKLFPRDLHKMISEAKDIREKADYGDFFKVSKEVATAHIANAEVFLKRVEDVLNKMIVELENQ